MLLPLLSLKVFCAPFTFDGFSARAGFFFETAAAFRAGFFFAEVVVFFTGFALFDLEAELFERAGAFFADLDLAGFFETFFF